MPAALPSARELRDHLADLLGRRVELGWAPPFAPTTRDAASHAVYVDARLHTVGVVSVDLPLSVYLGAARGLIPVGATDEIIDSAEIRAPLDQYLSEVLASLADLQVLPDGDTARFHASYLPGAVPPDDIRAYAKSVGRRLDLQIGLRGYGSGRMSLVLPA